MKTVLFYTFIVWTFSLHGQEKIQWMSWQEAVNARNTFIQENQESIKAGKAFPKKIFIDVYTNWCGWCKKMDASTFVDQNVVKYMNDKYYAVKLNAEMKDTIVFDGHSFMNSQPESSKGTHMLAYSLLDGKMSYPSYVILDENMKRAHVIAGYKNSLDFLATLVFFGSNEYLSYKEYLDKMLQIQKAK